MIISNLVFFMEHDFVLSSEIKNKIDFIIRDSENFQSGKVICQNFNLEYNLHKIESKDNYEFLKSHKNFYEIIYIQSGSINLIVSNRNKAKQLDFKFDENEYDFFTQENFFQVNNLNKSDLILFHSTDTYKIITNSNICKYILFKITKNE